MIISTGETPVYEYKGKPYSIIQHSKIKHEGTWKDVVIYQCNYDNPDGMIWVRFADEFFLRFKTLEQ